MGEYSYSVCRGCGGFNRFPELANTRTPVCGKCKKSLDYRAGVTDVDSAGLERLIAKSPLPVFVDFWAEWCGPCRFFAPIFEKVAREHFGDAVFAKVDTEAEARAGQKYGISAIPTLIVFRGGRESHRQQGALPEPAFRQLVETML